MKTALRLMLMTAAVLTVLSTVALVGALQWLSAQDTVRLFIDGEQVRLNAGAHGGWLPVIAATAAVLLVVFLVVPLVVLLALGIAAAAAVISLVAALSPLLLLGAVAWWIFRRQTAAVPSRAPNAPGPMPKG